MKRNNNDCDSANSCYLLHSLNREGSGHKNKNSGKA